MVGGTADERKYLSSLIHCLEFQSINNSSSPNKRQKEFDTLTTAARHSCDARRIPFEFPKCEPNEVRSVFSFNTFDANMQCTFPPT